MTSISSSAIGKGSGSAGVFTYRTVRGRTIASSRITTNRSNTKQQASQRAAFAEVQRLGKVLKAIIPVGFDKTQYGSARNNFLKKNSPYMDYIRENGPSRSHSVPLHNLWSTLNDPRFKAQVTAACGDDDIAATFRWSAEGIPTAQLVHYRPFRPGDTLTFTLGITCLFFGKRLSRLIIFDKQLSEDDIAALPNNQFATFDKTNCPQLDFRSLLPVEADDITVVAAAIITAPDGVRSTSYFTAMPILPVACTASTHRFIGGGKMEILFPSAETFPAALARNAVGASLRFPAMEVAQSYLVTALVCDGQGQPIGFTIEDKLNLEYAADPKGSSSAPCPLTKDNQTIALISGLTTPALMS